MIECNLLQKVQSQSLKIPIHPEEIRKQMEQSLLKLGKIAATICFASFSTTSHAADLAQPKSEIILTVSGGIASTNDNDTAVFDLDMIKELGMTSIETTTIWTEGVQSFVGVPLTALLEAVEAEGTVIKATAVNDYAIEIPLDDPTSTAALIAYENNGSVMTLRDKGPLWIVYPYDEAPQFQTEVVYSRSIWQLDRIEITE